MKRRSLFALLGFSLLALASCDISNWGTYQIIGYNWDPKGGKGQEYGYVFFHTGKGSAIKTRSLAEGKALDLRDAISTWEGHEFIGWYLDEKLTNNDIPEYMGAKSIHLYASWTMDLDAPRFLMGKYPTRFVKIDERDPKKDYYQLWHNNAGFTASDGTYVPADSTELYFEYDYLSWDVHPDGNHRYLLSLKDAVAPCYILGSFEDHGFDNEHFSYNDVFSSVERERVFSIEHPLPKYDIIKNIGFEGATDYAKALGLSEDATHLMLVKDNGVEYVYNTKSKALSEIAEMGESVPYAYRPVLRYMEEGSSFLIHYDRSPVGEADTYQRIPIENRNQSTQLETIASDGYSFGEDGTPYHTRFDYWEDIDSHATYMWTIEGIDDDITLYPRFEEVPFREEVNIRYHLGYDNAENNVANPNRASFGSTVNLKKPTCPGETFEAWYYDEYFTQFAGVGAIENFGAWHVPDYRGIDLYAKWAPEVCNISYKDVETTNHPDNPIHYIHNSKTPLPLYAPSRNTAEPKRFKGWKYEGSFVYEISPEMMRSEGISLSGVWELVYSTEVFYIDYDFGADDVTCSNSSSYTTSYTSATTTFRLPNVSRPGYWLWGWTPDNKQTRIQDGDAGSIRGFYDNILLTAVWRAN